MKMLLAVLLFAPVASAAGSTDVAYDEAMVAAEKCEAAWFDRSRRDALTTIDRAGMTIATAINPMSENYETQMDQLSDVTDALKRCAALVYGD